ncbi:MAG: DUF885 domain-containing protein [Deltaproteobacteria bacterium]|nr:DUF885 domain-containing protein [Deltaproteobacteria bacterium]
MTTNTLPYDDRSDLIKKDRLEAFFRLAPEFATIVGYHAHDHLLPHAAREHVEEELRFLGDWVAELRRLPAEQLTPDQQLDRDLFERAYAFQRFYYEDLRNWERNPEAIAEVGQILFMTLLYEADDEEKRFSDIAARLEQLPRYVKEHKSRITTPPRRWRDLAIETTQAMPAFFDALLQAAGLKASPALAGRISKGVAVAKAETTAYIDWLKGLSIDEAESWVLGPEQFAELIRLRDLGCTVREIMELGQESLGKYQAELTRLAVEIVGAPDVDAARAKVEADAPPDFSAALAATRKACDEAKAFLQKHHLVDLPKEERLEVVETPAFLRPLIPFAAIFPPARFDRQQKGTYIVSPPANPADLKKHLNYAGLYNTAVHEAYPGHHLQLTTANLRCSFMRSTPVAGGKATELVEGWAHYCEELMKDRGFHDSTAGRFVMVSDLVWRATRIIIDIDLSQGAMGYDDGVRMLVEQARLPEPGARAELNRYTHTPSYQLSYLLGKHQILALKQAVKAKEREKFSESAFHNRLLAAGSIPISVIRRAIFQV